MKNQQKGVTLIITFFITTIIITILLSISTILFREIKILGAIGNSVSAFYTNDSAREKALYINKK